MNLIRTLALASTLFLGACTVELISDPAPPGTYNTTVVEETYYETGYYCEDPYWHEPEWCDYYDDATCCVWYADGWYEEWCQWDYDYCWDYNGSW